MKTARTVQERITETTLAYYRLLEARPATPLEVTKWFAQLPLGQKLQIRHISQDAVPQLSTFRRYVLESRDCAMRAFMERALSQQDFLYWVDNEADGI